MQVADLAESSATQPGSQSAAGACYHRFTVVLPGPRTMALVACCCASLPLGCRSRGLPAGEVGRLSGKLAFTVGSGTGEISEAGRIGVWLQPAPGACGSLTPPADGEATLMLEACDPGVRGDEAHRYGIRPGPKGCPDGGAALLLFRRDPATHFVWAPLQGQSGYLEILEADDGGVRGRFDTELAAPDGGDRSRLSGEFAVPACQARMMLQ